MLLDRQAEIKIIVDRLNAEKSHQLKTLAGMRVWASISSIVLDAYEPYSKVKTKVVELDKTLNYYEDLLK